MSKHGYAYFVKRPRRAEDLMRLHAVDEEREYEIAKTIVLSSIDYENFITDMLADRAFLEENAHLCSCGNHLRCLFVHSRKSTEGILVVPDGAFVNIAALKTVDRSNLEK